MIDLKKGIVEKREETEIFFSKKKSNKILSSVL